MKGIIDKINGDIITVELFCGAMLDIKNINNLTLSEGLFIEINGNNVISDIYHSDTQDRLSRNINLLEKLKNKF